MDTRRLSIAVSIALGASLAGCSIRPSQMPPGPDWGQYVVNRPGASGPAARSWRPDVCAQFDLHTDYRTLNETSIVEFLRNQQLGVRVERQAVDPKKPELIFVFVQAPGSGASVPLRVAILPGADDAGHELYEAMLQRGPGAWGIHRANIAVLGPTGADEEDLAFAARTKLACWGTFSQATLGDVVVVPGGYTEP
jgi:hypothetical protein